MFKILATIFLLTPLVLSAQLAARSEVFARQGTCPARAPVSCGGNFCRPTDATCCPAGFYCPAGQYCAPVVGYCCLNGEDPSTCATRQRLTIVVPSGTTPSVPSVSPPAVSSPLAVSTPPAMSTPPAISSPPAISLPPAVSTPRSSAVASATVSAPLPEFTGAASKKDSAIAAMLVGVAGLMAVL